MLSESTSNIFLGEPLSDALCTGWLPSCLSREILKDKRPCQSFVKLAIRGEKFGQDRLFNRLEDATT